MQSVFTDCKLFRKQSTVFCITQLLLPAPQRRTSLDKKALVINISRNNNSGNCKFTVLNYNGNLLQRVRRFALKRK